MRPIHYYIDGVEYVLTENGERQKASEYYKEVAESDERCGYNDRMAHCYDKWYRYNRHDNGAAYDRGVQRAVNEKHSAKWIQEDELHFYIIECKAVTA